MAKSIGNEKRRSNGTKKTNQGNSTNTKRTTKIRQQQKGKSNRGQG